MKIKTITRLYHGTNKRFDKFDFEFAKSFKDYGKGIYLTSDFQQAQRWAQVKSSKQEEAFVYSYSIKNFENEDWKVLELLKYDKEWIDFISNSRINGIETDYDIIYDRIADNQYSEISETLQAYIDNDITCEIAIEKIRWKNGKSDQYCFKNKEVLSLLNDRQVIRQIKDSSGKWILEI